MSATAPSRRRFLVGGAAAVGAATVALACTGDDKKGGTSGGTTASTRPPGEVDLDAAALAAGIEKLAVDTYTGAATLATQGKLGAALPAAVVELVTAAARQHEEHLDLWNKMLTDKGRPAVAAADAQLKPAVDAAMGKLADVPAVATLALRLEDYASQTYVKLIPTISGADMVKAAAQILVVDQQHQAVLRYLVGLSPVGSGVVMEPKDFAPADPQISLITG